MDEAVDSQVKRSRSQLLELILGKSSTLRRRCKLSPRLTEALQMVTKLLTVNLSNTPVASVQKMQLMLSNLISKISVTNNTGTYIQLYYIHTLPPKSPPRVADHRPLTLNNNNIPSRYF